MSVSINGTGGLTFSDSSVQSTAATGFGFKNRIINGAMMIDQRNAGASVTPTTTTYTLDRWRAIASQSSKFSLQQNAGSVTPPVGFTNYLGVTSLSAYSVTTGDIFSLQQKIEGYNVADLGYGTANASTTTLSFWVRSSLTGTFGGVFGNEAANRCYVFSYTINAANTWEQKTITVAGDTTGTWLTTNGVGLDVRFSFGSGSDKLAAAGSWGSTFYNSVTGQTSVVGTNGASFYITGVQLEKGSTATAYDYRPYGTELALCQRYCIKYGGNSTYERIANAGCNDSTRFEAQVFLPVEMRSTPTVSYSSASHWAFGNFASGANTVGTAMTTGTVVSGTKMANIQVTGASGLTGGTVGLFNANNTTSAWLVLSAEL